MHAALSDRFLHGADNQPQAGALDELVAEREGLGEIVASIDVQQGQRRAGGQERLAGQPEKHGGVLAAGEEQHGALELRDHLPQHEDGLVFELVEVGQRVRDHAGRRSSGPTRANSRAAVAAADSFSVLSTNRQAPGTGGSNAESRPVNWGTWSAWARA